MTKVAVILAGCGFLDGAEIREVVITTLFLDKYNLNYDFFAPNKDQHHVVNHLTNQEAGESRNILVESARITRGKVKNIEELNTNDYNALILPGGFGVAKNFSNLAFEGSDLSLEPNIEKIINNFYDQKKAIAAMCISPAIVTKALQNKAKINVTLGNDSDNLINNLGGIHSNAKANEIIFDESNLIISTPAYMLDENLFQISLGIEQLINKLMEISK